MSTGYPLVTQASPQAFDAAQFRHVLGNFPTGVVAVSAIHDGEPVGLAVGSFTSVSLDPPLVGFFPGKASTSWPRIAQAGSFVVNVLAEHQADVCRSFAASGQDKYSGFSWQRSPGGSPVLHGVVAWLECELASVTDAGDHWFVLGRVVRMAVTGSRLPLVFFRGAYTSLSG
jgi:3-hydroxy-9,10-secoandrosta-1,3,5(10)-triene-9,17-dione monooxygenase reductase component